MNGFQKAKASIAGVGAALIANSYVKDKELIEQFEDVQGEPIGSKEFVKENVVRISQMYNDLMIKIFYYKETDCALVRPKYNQDMSINHFELHISLDNDKNTLYHELGHIMDCMETGNFRSFAVPDAQFIEKKRQILNDEKAAYDQAERLFSDNVSNEELELFKKSKNICLNTYKNQLNRSKVAAYTVAGYGLVSLCEWMLDDYTGKGRK